MTKESKLDTDLGPPGMARRFGPLSEYERETAIKDEARLDRVLRPRIEQARDSLIDAESKPKRGRPKKAKP